MQTRADRLESSNRLLATVACAFACVLVVATVLLGNETIGREPRIAISIALRSLLLLLGCSFSFLAARRQASRRSKLGWIAVAIALLFNALGHLAWGSQNWLVDEDGAVVTVADGFFALVYPFLIAGIVLLGPRHKTFLSAATDWLDSIIFGLSVGCLNWVAVIQPALGLESPTDAAPLLCLVYPCLDLILMWSLTAIALQHPLKQVPLWLVLGLGSVAAAIAADDAFCVTTISGTYQMGDRVDLAYVLSYALLGLAAASALANRRTGFPATGEDQELQRHLRWTRLILPYTCLPIVGLAFALQSARIQASWVEDAKPLLIAFYGLVILVLVRQFLTMMDNRRLALSLAAAGNSVRTQANERARELALLNSSVSLLSQCDRSESALRVGLNLSLTALGWSKGVAWLESFNKTSSPVQRFEMPDEQVECLRELLFATGQYRQYASTGRAVALATREWDAAAKMCLSHKRANPDAADSADQAMPAYIVIVPLISRGTTVGAFTLLSPLVAQAPGATSLDLVGAIGAETGLAYDNIVRYEQARRLADIDPVTGLLNHRAFHERLASHLKDPAIEDQPLAVVMMDMDGFKLFNDTYGHPKGDSILRRVAGILRSSGGDKALIARYGGDEFVALLSGSDKEAAIEFAERVRSALAAESWLGEGEVDIPIHMSFGIAAYPANGSDPHELITWADSSLYESKQLGGDRVTAERQEALDAVHVLGSSFGILEGLVIAVDNKDRYTRRHSEDVTRYALAIAARIGLSEDSMRTLRIAGLLHDVGKIGVPDRVLRKPGLLDADEMEIVRQHVQIGESIIRAVPNVDQVLAAVASHHERIDGRGYPRGLKGNAIPPLGRILAVADAYSAMTTDRPYRRAMDHAQACEEMQRVAGSQLDANLVHEFITYLETADSSVEHDQDCPYDLLPIASQR